MTTIEETADELVAAVQQHLAGWVEREVERLCGAWSGSIAPRVRDAAVEAGQGATESIVPELRGLLELDIDDQSTNPLAILRRAVAFPTAVLRDAGVPPVVRDEFAEANFPDDPYDLTPGAFADIAAELHEPGLRWGAAKAHTHLQRRRADGQR